AADFASSSLSFSTAASTATAKPASLSLEHVPTTRISRAPASTSIPLNLNVVSSDWSINSEKSFAGGRNSSNSWIRETVPSVPNRHHTSTSTTSIANEAALLDRIAKLIPSHFTLDLYSRKDNHDMLALSDSATRATYIGPGHSDRDSASVRSNLPIPRTLSDGVYLKIFYFEVLVVSEGKDGWMGIGCCTKDVNLDRLPGNELFLVIYE
ncbi:Ran-binding protein 9, partial [Rhizoclosmatium hyalinum]